MDDIPRPTVLIVDDDRVNRSALAELLQDDCHILPARDGASALQILEREEVTLVLLDVSMPGMDGYEVLRRIKSNPATADLGVIFITGMTETADEERGLLSGAADYVQKPLRPAIARARIHVHLKLAMQRRQLERLSLQDGLTGIANRRYLDLSLEQSVRQMARAGKSLGLAIFDVDHFKQYNDFYGHGAGDHALREVARTLKGFARRPGDVAARYGGEEFTLLLTEVHDLHPLIDALRGAIEALGIPHARSLTGSVLTVSGGGVLIAPSAQTNASAILSHADRLLYRAKQDGRNRVIVEEDTSLHIPS